MVLVILILMIIIMLIIIKLLITISIIIRRALAQGVSDHRRFVSIATCVTSVKQLLHLFDFGAICCAPV